MERNQGLDKETIAAIEEAAAVVTKYGDELDAKAATLSEPHRNAIKALTDRMRLLAKVSRSMVAVSTAVDRVTIGQGFTPEQIEELKR